jgi:hypothetical protein
MKTLDIIVIIFMATMFVLVGGLITCEIIKTVHEIRKDK